MQLNDGILIAGHAAYYDPPLQPAVLRRRAAQTAMEGQLALDRSPRHAERLLRDAIELMVDAFLLDRHGGRDLFARAHTLGAFVENRFSCRWRLDEQGQTLENTCGILALHSRMGLSPGGRTWGRCSICSAEDFQCSHVPGSTYEGEHCHREIYRWDGAEVSMTARPRDPRCFRVWSPVRTAEVGGNSLGCQHCRACAGRMGPTDEDLDPSTWPDDPDVLIDATVAVSKAAASASVLEL
jgi:hypothetical protein